MHFWLVWILNFKTNAHKPLCICWARIHLLVYTITAPYWTLEILRTDFHLRPLKRFIFIFPVSPHHCLVVNFTIHVQAIEVWLVAILIPPSALKLGGTVVWVGVIILIFSAEWCTTMITERIASCSWKKKEFQWEFYDNVLKT